MTVLVTGGAGYVGSHMVLALQDAGRRVVVFDNLSTGFREAVPTGVAFVQGDVNDVALVRDTLDRHQVTAVIHFAGSILVEESMRAPLDYYHNNTLSTFALVRACVAEGVEHFILSSTAAVYGMPEVALVREDTPLKPISPYGASKAMSEQILRDAASAHGFSYVALRYFNVCGADADLRAGQRSRTGTHLFKVALQAALKQRNSVTVFGDNLPTRDGTAVRDYVHVSDVASAHIRALEHLERGGESLTLNCGYGRGYTVREVLAAVQAETGRGFAIEPGPRRAGDPVELVADPSQICAQLGWRPQYRDLGAMVRTAWQFERRMEAAGAGARSPAVAFGQER